jgi:NADP-dependent alcohol dehydrogenase
MNNFEYKNPVKVIFGKDTIPKLAAEIPSDSRVLITYGGGSIFKNGVYDQVKEALSGFTYFEFGGIEPNPLYETMMKALEIVRREKIDFLLAEAILRKSDPVARSGFLQSYLMFHQHCRTRYALIY